MPNLQFANRARKRQQGIAAIEFAIVFPVFFAILYGIITYGLILAAQQTLTMSASEGARAFLRYQTNVAERKTSACAVSNVATLWIRSIAGAAAASSNCVPAGQAGVHVSDPEACGAYKCRKIIVTYNYKLNPLIPPLGLPVPDALTGSAIVQVVE